MRDLKDVLKGHMADSRNTTENEILQKLEKFLLDKGYTQNMLMRDYEFDSNKSNSKLKFDLAVVENGAPVEIYEVKAFYTKPVKYTRSYQLFKSLDHLHTRVPAFIAYLNQAGKLILQSMAPPIKSFSDFYATLDVYVKYQMDDNYVYFYRGHNDEQYSFQPGIYRQSASRNISEEDIMYREAIRHCPAEFPENMRFFENLVKMQHYALPTRLLDITTNPLVALYFACSGADNANGEVIFFKVKKSDIKYFDSDTVSIIANIAKCKCDFDIDSSLSIQTFNATANVQSLLHEIKQEKTHFKDCIKPEDLGRVLCVLPKLNNPRIAKQSGAFFLYGITKNKRNPAKLQHAPRRIVINAEYKKIILRELANLGITNASLFPEIDNIMKSIKNK